MSAAKRVAKKRKTSDDDAESDAKAKPKTRALTSLSLSELKDLAESNKVDMSKSDNPKKAHYIAALNAAGVTAEPLKVRAKTTKKKTADKSKSAAAAAADDDADDADEASDASDASDGAEDDDEEEEEDDKPKKKKKKTTAVKKQPEKKKAAPKKKKKSAASDDESDGDDSDDGGKQKKKKGGGGGGSDNASKLESIKDELSKFTNDQLKAELVRNEQIKSGNKGDLIARVADGRLYGALPRCSSCYAATLKVTYTSKDHGGQGNFKCHGHMEDDRYFACSYRSTHENRPKWKMSDDE